MIHLPDGDIDFFYIVASVLQGDTLAPYMCWEFTNLIRRNYANDLALLTNAYLSQIPTTQPEGSSCRN